MSWARAGFCDDEVTFEHKTEVGERKSQVNGWEESSGHSKRKGAAVGPGQGQTGRQQGLDQAGPPLYPGHGKGFGFYTECGGRY